MLCVVALTLISLARAQTDPLTVKATFLYRFASFVQWPATVDQQGPVTLCVAGSPRLGAAVSRMVHDQHLGARPFLVRAADDAPSATGCHILFLGDDEVSARQLLRATAAMPILTVTDGDNTPDTRGMIHFVIIDDHVRFHIDDDRAAQAHLIIAPQLLNLAVSVRRRGQS